MKSEAYWAGWRAAEIGYLEDVAEVVVASSKDADEFRQGFVDQRKRERLEGLCFALCGLAAVVFLLLVGL